MTGRSPGGDRRQEPAPTVRGLTGEEVRRRRARGEVNRVALPTSRPVGDILRGNILTLFNAVLAGAVVLLLTIGQLRDAFLTGGLIVFSVGVSMAQEIRAKLRLERIALLARVRVRVIRDGREQTIDQDDLVLGDYLLLSRGEPVVVDGRVVLADRLEIDESHLTGESEPVVKVAGDSVLSASFCVAGTGIYVAEGIGESSYAQRLAAAARSYQYSRTPIQRSLDRVLRVLLAIVVAISLLQATVFLLRGGSVTDAIRATAVVATLVPQGLLLMSTVAYSVGAVRLAQAGVLVQQLNAIESLSHADVLCIDKTGTLTRNRLRLQEVVPIVRREPPVEELVGLFAASFPEPSATVQAIASGLPAKPCPVAGAVPFSSERGWSSLTFAPPCPFGTLVLGAPELLLGQARGAAGVAERSRELAVAGRRVLLLARAPERPPGGVGIEEAEGGPRLPKGLQALALISLEEEVRAEAAPTLELLARQGISVKVISGDSPATALAIARRAGLPTAREAVSGAELAALSTGAKRAAVERTAVFGRISPQEKQEIVRALEGRGHYVAMIGDGVNDVLALKQANVSIAMGSGSPAARTVADIVLLNDAFDLLPKGLSEGRRIVNGLMLLVKLFLIRDAAALELILATSLAGAPFPLLPPHAALIAILTVGIPALMIVAWASPEAPGRESLGAVATIVMQIGTTSALAIGSVYVLALIGFEADVAQARTAVVTAALTSGLLVLIVFRYPLDAPLSLLLADRRVALLAVAIFAVYVLGLYWPTWQRYFELTPVSPFDWVVILPIVVAWFGILRLVARYRIVERLLER